MAPETKPAFIVLSRSLVSSSSFLSYSLSLSLSRTFILSHSLCRNWSIIRCKRVNRVWRTIDRLTHISFRSTCCSEIVYRSACINTALKASFLALLLSLSLSPSHFSSSLPLYPQLCRRSVLSFHRKPHARSQQQRHVLYTHVSPASLFFRSIPRSVTNLRENMVAIFHLKLDH